MVRYQSEQRIKEKLEQNQLLLIKDAKLKRNTVLKTRTKTILKAANATRTEEAKTKTKSNIKRKLLVYRKDDSFYIDNAAAYALKLTNVRAIMTDTPHLIELEPETLQKFQNDENIEIEYEELDQEKEAGAGGDDLEAILGELEQGEYGIGIHGIAQGDSVEKQIIASSISNKGLNLNNNSKTILSTSISLGTNEDMQQICQGIMGYQFGKGAKANVIIAVPLYIQNESGERVFLGFPDENKRTAGQQYEEHCILDRICAKLNRIPPEFILGYYCEAPDGSKNFIKNGQHYSNITPEKKEDLFNELSSNMDDISKKYNNLIASGNMEQLSQMKEKMQRLGWNSYMVNNAMTLVQKYKGQVVSRDNRNKSSRQFILKAEQQSDKTVIQEEKNVRKIILDDVPRTERPVNKSKRRILLEACAGVKLSDISKAKETLREGLEETEKKYEGKEI